MNTPLFSAMDAYVKRDAARFHMPGHKGVLPWMREDATFGGLAKLDITEVDGCDSLYEASTAIAETEREYAQLYDCAASLISAGGSTLCIQTMLAVAVKPTQEIVCARGCHVAAVNAMAMLGIKPHWVYPETDSTTGLAMAVTAPQIRAALRENPHAAAVYVTSPNYYGLICNIAEISKVCREYAVPLLVDNAHGAYLRFLSPSKHPINLGADICNDSLHKTLPVLTGGAMLHIKTPKYVREAKRYMSVFGSTSPNYLIMLSIDKALLPLKTDFTEQLAATALEVSRLEQIAQDEGFLIPAGERDPLRLALGFGAVGYKSDEFMRLLRQSEIEPEMVDVGFAVFMSSPWNRREDFERLEKFIKTLPKRTPLPIKIFDMVRPKSIKSLHDAVFAPLVEVPLENAVGKVAGSIISPCPPGMPLVIPGERIDENLMCYLKNYGISKLNVLE